MNKIWINFLLSTFLFTPGIFLACANTPSPKADSPDIEATVQARVNAESTVEARVKEELSKSTPEEPTPVPPIPTLVPPIPTSVPPIPSPMPTSTPQQVSIYENVRESIVRIETPKGAVGTGFFVSSDGLIVTNAHVVEGSESVSVSLYKGVERSGLVLGTFENEDLALVSIEAFNVSPIPYSQTIKTQIGDPVEAIGFALDLFGEPTLTKGYISAYRERLAGNLSGIQTDAALNPGNSGGPLFNGNGDLIGINTSIVADAEGINFAIDINDARPLIEALIAGHSVPLGRYINDQYPFTIDVKDGWDIYEFTPLADEYFNLHTVMRKNSSSGEISIFTHDLSGELTNLTTDKFAEYMYELGSDQEFDYYQKLNSKELELSETVNLWAIEEKWKRPNLDYENTGIEYFFVNRGVGYAIFTQSASNKWSSLKPEFEEMVESFKIDASSGKGPIAKATQIPLADVTKTRFDNVIADFQISFEYPSDWLKIGPNENNYGAYSSVTGDEFRVYFFSKSYTANSLLSAVTDFGFAPNPSPKWQEFEIQTQTYRNLFGYDGYEFMATYTNDSGYDRRDYILFLDAGNGDVFQITMNSDATNWTPSGDNILGYAPPEVLKDVFDSLDLLPKKTESTHTPIPTSVPTNSLSRIYENEVNGFNFRYPSDWEIYEDDKNIVRLGTDIAQIMFEITDYPQSYPGLEEAINSNWGIIPREENKNPVMLFEGLPGARLHNLTGFLWSDTYDSTAGRAQESNYVFELGESRALRIYISAVSDQWQKTDIPLYGLSTNFQPKGLIREILESFSLAENKANVIPTLTAIPTFDSELLFGPWSGIIQGNPEDKKISIHPTDVVENNTVISANFTPPHYENSHTRTWSQGIVHRKDYSGQYSLVIKNNQNWYHKLLISSEGQDTQFITVDSGYSSHINITPGSSNTIKLISLGERGWLWINDQYIEELSFSDRTDPGKIQFGGGFFAGDEIGGERYIMEDVKIKSIESMEVPYPSNSIRHDPTSGKTVVDKIGDMKVANFILEFQVDNPVQKWSTGANIRLDASKSMWYPITVGYIGNGYGWTHYLSTENNSWEIIGSGYYPGFNVSKGESNKFMIIADGSNGALFANNNFVASLDLSRHISDGRIQIYGDVYGNQIVNGETKFHGTKLWHLGD